MKYVTKSSLNQLEISDITGDLPDLKNIKESKAVAIGKWLTNVIEKNHKFKPDTLLPSKPDLAYFLGVSIGTVQNALRYVEDLGYVQSKQCIGTIIKDKSDNQQVRKFTSKREIAINRLKKYIKDNNYTIGSMLPVSRTIADAIGCSVNTTRLALEYLCSENILEHKFKNSYKFDENSEQIGWCVKSDDFSYNLTEDDNETLVKKVENDLKQYITDNLHSGDRIPAHNTLSEKLSVSIKTIHDALKSLIDDGILLAKRGRYGTTVLRMPNEMNVSDKKETSIFAPAQDTAFYYYEKIQNHIKKMITDNYQIGDKLPSVNELALQLDISPNTVRKAFHNLAKDGYLVFSRGRYGGTFVIDMPETNEQTYKWLAVNPKYKEVYGKN